MDQTEHSKNGITVVIPLGGGKSESNSPNDRRPTRTKRSCNPHAREWPPVSPTIAPHEKRPRMSTVQPTSAPAPPVSDSLLRKDPYLSVDLFKNEVKPQREVKVFRQPPLPPPAATKAQTTPDITKDKKETDSIPIHYHVAKFIFAEWKDAQFTPRDISQGGSKYIRGLKMKEIEAALLLLSQQGLLTRKLKCEKGERCTFIYTPMNLEQLHPLDQKLARDYYGLEF